MKRKDVDEVNDDFFDFTLSSALKIRRLDTDLTPIIDGHGPSNSELFEQSMPLQYNFVEQSMGSNPVVIDEPRSSVPLNEERAIVLFNPKNNPSALNSSLPFTFSADSDFLSRFKNPVIWSNESDKPKFLADETQNEEDNSGVVNGCLAVVPWVPGHPQHSPNPEFETHDAQTSDMMDLDDMDVEDNCNTQQMLNQQYVTTRNQWQQHCMIQQPSSNLSTPVIWLG